MLWAIVNFDDSGWVWLPTICGPYLQMSNLPHLDLSDFLFHLDQNYGYETNKQNLCPIKREGLGFQQEPGQARQSVAEMENALQHRYNKKSQLTAHL